MASIEEIFNSAHSKPCDFQSFLKSYAQSVGGIVNSYIPQSNNKDANFYLYDIFARYSKNAGKRHRPLICLAACEAVGGNVEKALSTASAIEHFHTAALIHDDIADDALLRRGEPCMHLTEGLGIAINCGDLGLSMVCGIVAEDKNLDSEIKVRVIQELYAMQKRTIEGQALDIGWARDGRYDISEEDYMFMARHKTAFYSGAVPLALGALIGGGSEEEIQALRAFGEASGLAFQIQDDILNLVGKKEATKKDFRGDITEGKRTLITIHALSHSNKKQRLIEILSSKEENPEVLAEAVEIMQESGSIDYARQYAERLACEAKASLVKVLDESLARTWLCSMADWFVERLQ